MHFNIWGNTMSLTPYQIKNFAKIKKSSRTTAFHESVISNDSETFFSYVNHFSNKINLNVNVNNNFTLAMYAFNAGIISRNNGKEDFSIFNFIYQQPSFNKNMSSRNGHNLLTLAARTGEIKWFCLFEQDGIQEPKNKEVINSALKGALFHNSHHAQPFTLVDYILTQPQYSIKHNVPQIMNALSNLYYSKNKSHQIKNLFFTLFEKGGVPLSSYGNSSFLLFHAIKNNDLKLYKEITALPLYQQIMDKTTFSSYNEHPFHEIIETNNPDILEDFISQNGLETLTQFPSGVFLQKVLKRAIRRNDPTLFKRCVLEIGMNPMEGDLNFAEINQSALHFVLNTDHNKDIIDYLDIIAKHPAFRIKHKFGVYKQNFLQVLYKRYPLHINLEEKSQQISRELNWLKSHNFDFFSQKHTIEPVFIMASKGDKKTYNETISKIDLTRKNNDNYLLFSMNEKHINYIVGTINNYNQDSQKYLQVSELIKDYYKRVARSVNLLELNMEGQTLFESIDNNLNKYHNFILEIRDVLYFEFIAQQKAYIASQTPCKATLEITRL